MEHKEVILAHAWRTFWVTMVGFAIAIVVGVLLGFLIGSSRLAYAAVYPLMTAFNALPKAAFVPILLGMFRKERALADMYRALKPGGRVLILEFSHPIAPGLKPAYDLYSFAVLPVLGKLVAGDAASYRYLAESIRLHPDQETLLRLMEAAGFERCQYFNLTGGIVAVHRGYKF